MKFIVFGVTDGDRFFGSERYFNPCLGHARATGGRVWGISVPGKHHRSQGLGKRQHLMPGVTGHGHRHPRAPDSRYLSTRIHPITA
jgi:hypothetical protein